MHRLISLLKPINPRKPNSRVIYPLQNLSSQSILTTTSLRNSTIIPNISPPFQPSTTLPASANGNFSSGYLLKQANVRRSSQNPTGFSSIPSLVKETRSFCSESGRESLDYDVVIVGAGPAGLSAAIRLKQMCRENDVDLSVCVVEKGAEVGAHIISGNVFEPRALDELLPQWRQEGAPIAVPVSSDKFWLLTKDRALSLPSPFNNEGNYVISLNQLVRWMGTKAEELGIEIYPGFAASEILYDANHKVIGIGTNDMGIAKDGSKKATFQRGVELKGVVSQTDGCEECFSTRGVEGINLYVSTS